LLEHRICAAAVLTAIPLMNYHTDRAASAQQQLRISSGQEHTLSRSHYRQTF